MEPPMGVNLSIKNVPEHVVEALKDRAQRNYRSLQGELRTIVEEAASEGALHGQVKRTREASGHGLWEDPRRFASEPGTRRALTIRETIRRQSSGACAMNVTVVDASALIAVLLVEAEAEAVVSRLTDSKLTAPSLLPFEIAAVCAMRFRRDRQKVNFLREALRAFEALHVTTWPIDIFAVFELANETGLTAYDASYLWLARELGAELVTLDGELQRAYAAMTGP